MTAIPETVAPPQVELVDDDGVPMDSIWHRDNMWLLSEQVRYHLRHRQDYFVGGNMFIYFDVEQARNRNFRGPDFFYVKGVRWGPLRRFWVVWEEGGRYPNVITELLSPSTAEDDLTTKKEVYQNTFRTPEYFCYDPDTQQLQGWRLLAGVYEPIQPNDKGWLWSEELQLWLGTWQGKYQNNEATWLRWYDRDGNVVPVFVEAERQKAEAERQKAKVERQKAEAERQKAEAERQKAEAERQKAEAERLRAEKAEAELARLKKRRKGT